MALRKMRSTPLSEAVKDPLIQEAAQARYTQLVRSGNQDAANSFAHAMGISDAAKQRAASEVILGRLGIRPRR